MSENSRYEAIVMGVSSGGMSAMKIMLPIFPKNFSIPVIIVQHIGARAVNEWIKLLHNKCRIHIKEADEKELIEPGNVYIAPANYHLLIEKDRTFSLTIDERVNYARPAIDVLFESAAETYGKSLIGIVLTGSNHDGTAGIKRIQECGGLTIVEDPATAQSAFMPASAISAIQPDYILPLKEIIETLVKLSTN